MRCKECDLDIVGGGDGYPYHSSPHFCIARLSEKLESLLALIHRDGGHHQDRYGTDASVKAAIDILNKRKAGIAE